MSDNHALADRLTETGTQALDLRFTDLLGAWRHLSFDVATVAAEDFERFRLFDGSAIAGWRDLDESDLALLPDPMRTWADPFTAQPTLACIADVVDPATRQGYERCPRSALKRTLAEVRESGIAEQFHIAADIVFYLFDRLELTQDAQALGFKVEPATELMSGAQQQHYLAGQPHDTLADLRAEMVSVLAGLGVRGLTHQASHGPGQCEIRLGPADALTMADHLQIARHAIDSVARAYGKVASFLPLPLAGVVGSGLHLHIALERDGQWLFAGQGYADLSATCLHAIGGLLRHTPSLNAFTNPSTNSYRRLRLGRQEPAMLGFGAHNRSTAIRIPAAARPEEKRIELRFPDPLANPYLAIAGILLAVRDGIVQAIDPGEPADRNVYDLDVDDAAGLERCVSNLPRALEALEDATHSLFAGDAVPAELIAAYVALKRDEIDVIAGTPHPVEHLVYGC